MDYADLTKRFFSHPVSHDQEARISTVRDAFARFARQVSNELDEGRELSIVLTKLEEASFFAIASIAREGV